MTDNDAMAATRQRVGRRVIRFWTDAMGCTDHSGWVDDDNPDFPDRYLLVEYGETSVYFYNVASEEEAGRTHDGQEYPADWEIAEVVDLETGKSHGLVASGYSFTDHPMRGGDYTEAVDPTRCPTCGRSAEQAGLVVSGYRWMPIDDVDGDVEDKPTLLVDTDNEMVGVDPFNPADIADSEYELQCPNGHTWTVSADDIAMKGKA